ncbi:MAG: hypothetical protein Q9165_003483 [Trypethelium subeluteriae]
MAVGSKSTSQQQILGAKIRQTIAQEVVIQSEKSIDLLLGLLVFMSWAHYQAHSKPFLAVFAQLAMSLVFELGLNKPVPGEAQVAPCVKEKYLKPPTPRTMEERRAVLGCFFVTSIISSFLQKIDALRWTPHMDECLRVLDTKKESPNDKILVQLLQLQMIAQRMTESVEYTSEPSSLYLQSLQPHLQGFKTKLQTEARTDGKM